VTTLITYEQPSYRYAKRVKRVKPKRHKPRWPKETLFDKICERPAFLVYSFLWVWCFVTIPREASYFLIRQSAAVEYCTDAKMQSLVDYCDTNACSLDDRLYFHRIAAEQVIRCQSVPEPVSLL